MKYSRDPLVNCYRMLELSPHASPVEVRQAYLKLARRYHPDLNPTDELAAARFRQVHAAYQTLSKSLAERPSSRSDQATEPVDLMKYRAIEQVKRLLRSREYAQAKDRAEALTVYYPDDGAVRRLQAKTYQQWARELITRRQYSNARRYLQKALQLDPTNPRLWREIERDYGRIERQLHLFR
ncbi:MAG: DnaJ domain-containing protein [Cyanobacteria bacterium J06635_1]